MYYSPFTVFLSGAVTQTVFPYLGCDGSFVACAPSVVSIIRDYYVGSLLPYALRRRRSSAVLAALAILRIAVWPIPIRRRHIRQRSCGASVRIVTIVAAGRITADLLVTTWSHPSVIRDGDSRSCCRRRYDSHHDRHRRRLYRCWVYHYLYGRVYYYSRRWQPLLPFIVIIIVHLIYVTPHPLLHPKWSLRVASLTRTRVDGVRSQ